MGLVINTNLSALSSVRLLTQTNEEQAKSFQRIASGERIVSAGDDAAGLSISERLKVQIRSEAQAGKNTNQAISFIQVAEGALSEISNGVVRLRELAIQSASDTVGETERFTINQEAQGILQEVSRIAYVTSFNGVNLLNGNASSLTFQVGIKNTENDRISLSLENSDSRASSLGIEGLDLSTMGGARESLENLDLAFNKILINRASLGSMQNRLQSTSRTIQDVIEGYSGARSNIADTDIASETTNLVRANILQQAGIAVLAQANSSAALALKLL